MLKNKLLSREDFLSSLVVFIVALPLSLGIALASGVDIAAGLIAAIIGGVVVGLLSGVPLMVSGPAAGLTVLVLQVVQTHGLVGLAVATVICGLTQVLLGAFRAGAIFNRVPSGILNGMLAAIGLIILLGQLHVLMGSSVPSSPWLAISTLPGELYNQLSSGNWIVLALGILAVAIIVAWPKIAGKLSWLPGALPAVIIVTALAIPFELPRVTLSNFLGNMGNVLGQIEGLTWTASLIISGLGLAVVASAESLLTAKAAFILEQQRDKKAADPKLNKELVAQGVGNVTSGLLGGIPITGVIVRTAANITSGGHTRASTVLHGFWVALFVFLLPDLLQLVPLTVLAAILVATGIKLLNIKNLIIACRESRDEAALWITTLVAIVATDLLVGLGIGLLAWGLISILQPVKEPLLQMVSRPSRLTEERKN